jgi:hypothetical protein
MPSTVRVEKLEHRSALRRQLEPAFAKLPESVIEAVSSHMSPSQQQMKITFNYYGHYSSCRCFGATLGQRQLG